MLRAFKAILFVSIILFSLIPIQVSHASEVSDVKLFIVTAYYSPLSNQKYYTTGSYNGDIRLNGEGENGANGKGVFEGLLAGPSNYPFGTKIYFEGYGVGIIEDRGGAIVKAGVRGKEHDRIDIWMGYGEEGLRRALLWGTKTVKGKIVSPNTSVDLTFGEKILDKYKTLDVFPDTESSDIKKLQELFRELKLYNGKIDGKFESIKKSVIIFQVENGVIKNRDAVDAGYFGQKTRYALAKKFIKNPLKKEENSRLKIFNNLSINKKHKILLNYGEVAINPDSESDEIKKLQSMFQELGLYTKKIDGKYKNIEKHIIAIQKELGIIENDDDWGAGYFGSKTKTALWKYYGDIETKKEEKNNTFVKKKQLDVIVKKLHTAIEKIAIKKQKSKTTIKELLLKRIKKIISTTDKESLRIKLQYIADNL